MIADYKNYGQRRRHARLDSIATTVAYITATMLAVLYFLSLVPAP